MIAKFTEYLEWNVGKAIYVWGGQGQRYSTYAAIRAAIDRMETSSANERRALALLEKRIKEGLKPEEIMIVDCSGLGADWFVDNGLIPRDTTANGIKAMCREIAMGNAREGCCVFRVSDDDGDGDDFNDRAFHIGYVVKDGYVIHAKGRDDGVVKERMNTSYWEVCGIPKFWDTEEMEGDIMLRLGDMGANVQAWQEDLIDAGFALKADGDFGTITETQTKAFQKANGLKVDGIVGPNTFAKMDAVIGALTADPTVAELADAKALIENYKAQITALMKSRDAAESLISAVHNMTDGK